MRRTWLIFSQAVTVAVAVLFVVATLKPEWLRSGASMAPPGLVTLPAPIAPGTLPTTLGATGTVNSYAAAARRATPAVVSVTARKPPLRSAQSNDPWFRFFFGDRAQQQQQPQVGLGSGVIVSTQGYLLTNNHVVEGADDIDVQLADGRQARAKLIGTDPETDLAVLRIDLGALPVIALGDAAAMQVGDVVLAIGNPFNVGQTVTSGIVSALGRDRLGLSTFENFIQTDAAINPGNSGGALVDVQGRLIGINTAIYSRNGGSMGIGFAIPVDSARVVMQALLTDGRVTRGWIGVEPRDLSPELAASLRLGIDHGVLITGVLQGGPASRGGLRPGDVVVAIADAPVANTVQLLAAVAALKPNTEATVAVQRGNQPLQLKLRVAQRPPQRPRDGD